MRLSRLGAFIALAPLAGISIAQTQVPSSVHTKPDYPTKPILVKPGAQALSSFMGGSDDCATPDAIGGAGTFAFDTTLATTGLDGQNDSLCYDFGSSAIDVDVWFDWTADFGGTAVMSMCAGATSDTKIAAWPAFGCPIDGTVIACNDDTCGLASEITFAVTPGSNYILQVGAFPGAPGGVGTFDIGPPPPPPTSDDCATAIAIFGTGTFPGDNSGATTGAEGQNESNCYFFATSGIDSDVWYEWTADFSGIALASTCGGTVDSKLAVYAAGGCPADGTSLACNDDSCGLQSEVNWSVTTGVPYLIQVGTFPGAASGAFDLTIGLQPPPLVNDNCATPDVIAGQGSFAFNTVNATTGAEGQMETNCYEFGSSAINSDVWFDWTADADGIATVTMCLSGAASDTKIAAYPSGGCPVDGSSLACNDDTCGLQSEISFPVISGTAYLLQIGHFSTGVDEISAFDIGIGVAPTACLGAGGADTCASPELIWRTGEWCYNLVGRNVSPSVGQLHACAPALPGFGVDVWFKWLAPQANEYDLTTCGGGDVDTKIAVYEFQDCDNSMVPLLCNDDDLNCGPQSKLLFTPEQDAWYLIRVAVALTSPDPGPGSGRFSLCLSGSSCPNPTKRGQQYCLAAGNSVDPVNGSRISAFGSDSISAADLTLTADNAPNQPAIFYYGPNQIALPFGNGIRCVAGSVVRLPVIFGSGGTFVYPIDFNLPSVVFSPSSTNFQCWYRDPAGGGTFFNLSDAVEIIMVP